MASKTTLLPSDFQDSKRPANSIGTPAPCSTIHASFPMIAEQPTSLNVAWSPRPGVSSTELDTWGMALLLSQYERIAVARGWELDASSSATNPSTVPRFQGLPSHKSSLSVTDGLAPTVSVPVLSKTTASSCAASWKASPPPRTKIPSFAAIPVPTRRAVGAARPIPHGHATTKTAIANSRDHAAGERWISVLFYTEKL